MVDTEKLLIRVYDSSNLPDMTKIFSQCFPTEEWTDDDFNAFWNKMCSKKSNIIKVLTDDRNTYAVMLYSVHRGVCTIRRIGVHNDFRRKKLGQRLLLSLCGNNSSTTCKEFKVKIPRTNETAIRFFVTCGFVEKDDSSDSYCFLYLNK